MFVLLLSEANLTAENFVYNLAHDMYKRFAALFILLAFATQTLAGGFACAADGNYEGAAEMACCAQARSANASPVAMLCCQTVCGEPTSGTPGPQSETPGQSPQPPAPSLAVNHVPPVSVSLLAVVALNSKRATDGLLEHSDPPVLYLHNSAFLI